MQGAEKILLMIMCSTHCKEACNLIGCYSSDLLKAEHLVCCHSLHRRWLPLLGLLQ